MISQSYVIGLLIATLGGTAVGLERQWSGHADGPSARFGGIRTFTMLGAIAGMSGWFLMIQLQAAAIALLTGAILIIVVAYLAASRHDVDATTEVAGLVVIAAGVLAGTGSFRVASGIVALVTLLLVEKSRLHALVARIDDVSLRAALRFGVMALVILPLLPSGPFGPLGGIRPRELWALVLFFSGLSFLGFMARQIAGPRSGYLLTGLLGGLISSTNVTWTFARLSRTDRMLERQLAFGAVAANAMLFPRVLAAAAVLNPPLASKLIPYLLLPATIAVAVALFGVSRAMSVVPEPVERRNPLQLSDALQMAALFQIVLMAVHLARVGWGETGVYSSALVLGMTDVDALTLSMARGIGASESLNVAAVGIAVGVLSNTALKTIIALLLGTPAYRAIAATTLAMMFAVGLIVLVVWESRIS